MKLRALCSLLLALANIGAAAGGSSELVPTEDFARAPLYTHVQMAPDGRTLAFLAEKDGNPVIMFADFQTLKAMGVTAGAVPVYGAPQQVKSFQWIGDRRVVFSTVFWDEYFGGVSAVNCDTRNFVPLTGIGTYAHDLSHRALIARETIYAFEDEDQSILMLDLGLGSGEDLFFPDVVKVNTLNGGYRTVVKNPGDVTRWGVDYSGVVRWGMTRDGEEFGLIYRAKDGDPWQEVPRTKGHPEAIRPLAFDPSGESIYAAALSPNRRWAIYLVNPITGKLGDLIVGDPDYDIVPAEPVPSAFSRPVYSKLKKCLLGVFYVTDGPRFKWLDPDFATYQSLIDAHLTKTVNMIVGGTRNQRRLLVFASSDRDPGSYYLLDVGRRTISRILTRMPWIRPEQMASMYPIKYPARDGRVIHGYMTLPNGRPQRNLPLVVMPHGGPSVRDIWSFDPLVQLLANRGYAVMQMNYRGSPGFGAEFSRIAKHEIGRGIQDDIEDGARWAIAHQIADPKRVAIVGASYGGYSALFGLAKSPGLYRCGISIAGVTDWLGIIKGKTSGEYKFAYEHWVQQIGDPKNDAEFLRSISPVSFAAQITAPLLIVQGKEDRTVPPKQARMLIAEMGKNGRTPESLFLSGEGHGLTHEKSRVELFKRIEEFLAKNMGPEPGGS